MSSGSITIIAVIVVIVLGGLFLLTTSARRDRAAAQGFISRETRRRDRGNPLLTEAEEEVVPPVTGRAVERAAVLERRGEGTMLVAAPPSPPALPTYLDEEALGVTRRQFFNRGIVTLFSLGLAGFGASLIGFLWPTLQAGGFGSKITAGKLADIQGSVTSLKQPFYVPQGRFYIQPFPVEDVSKAQKIYSASIVEGMQSGLVALYQKCVHLGCRVPWCQSSQWFECPCHGSKYSRVGEYKAGPAPRGLDRFALSVGSNGDVVVDTSQVILGPPRGTDTTGQGQDGPHCA